MPFPEASVRHREVAALHRGGLLIIVGNVVNGIAVNGLHLCQRICDSSCQFSRLGHNSGVCVKVAELVRVQEGGLAVPDICRDSLAHHLGVGGALNLLEYLDRVGSASLCQRKYLVVSGGIQIVGVLGSLGNTHLDAGGSARILDHDIALGGVGGVDDGAAIGKDRCSGSLRRPHLGKRGDGQERSGQKA